MKLILKKVKSYFSPLNHISSENVSNVSLAVFFFFAIFETEAIREIFF